MVENEKCFTFIWKIKNFNFCYNKTEEIKSPTFFVHTMGGTRWYLCLRPNSSGFKSCVVCGIVAPESDLGQFEFDYEISFLASDGSVRHSEIFLKKLYKGSYEDWSAALYLKSDKVFSCNKDLFIPDEFLTVRCRMWDSKYSIAVPGRCIAVTLIVTNCESFTGKIKNFSSLEPREKYPVNFHSAVPTYLSSMNLCVAADGKLSIELEQKSLPMYSYKIYITDFLLKKVKCGQGQVNGSRLHYVPLPFSMEYLFKNKYYFLQGDELAIVCEIIFPTNEEIESIHEPEYGFEYQETQDSTTNSISSVVYSEKQHIENLTALKDDLTSLFKEGVLCDTKLKTATETFPAHAVVLSARSPVFKSMFSTDMKEKTNNTVDINDLDADTVRRMLLFIYSADLDNLDVESAKDLYFAADKYDITSLRHRCSNFLMQNIRLENCCEILLLADNHQDKDLKSSLLDYIAKNDDAVLFSGEWKKLEKDHPQLTIEALRTVCMIKRS